MKNIIRDILRSERKALHLTQHDLADKIGVCFRSIQNWEKDPLKIRLGDLLKICEVLGLEVSITKK